jgi:outer membrane protein assembly factor BamD (BamD/ComL family)
MRLPIFILKRAAFSVAGLLLTIGLCAVGPAGQAAPPATAPSPPSSPTLAELLANLETLKGRITDLERDRLVLREEQVFTNSEVVLIMSQTAGRSIPDWITTLTLHLDGQPLGVVTLTATHRAVLQESGFLLLARQTVAPGRHEVQLLAEGTGKKSAARREEAGIWIEKGAGGLWADLHFLGEAKSGQPLSVGVDQWAALSPAVSKQKSELPAWSAELALRGNDPLQAVSLFAVAQQRGLPQAQLVALQFRLADADLAAGMPDHVVALMTPYTRQEGSREAQEGWFYLEKAAYTGQRYREALAAFAHVTPKLRVSLYHEALYLAGNSNLQLKEYERAFTTLTQIPRYSEFYPFAQYSMGLAYLNFGDVYSAVESFRRLTNIEAGNNPALQSLIDRARLTVGYEFLHQKRYADAISQFAQVYPSSPLFDQALFGIGWGYFKLEEFVKAAVVFKDLRQRFPGSPYSQEALVALGFSYSKLQAFKLSIDQFRLALDSVTTLAQSIQERLDAMNRPEWVPPDTIDRFPVVSGLSSQVQLDDILNYFREEQTLQSALAQYRELARAIAMIDNGLRDLSQMALSQSQWLSGQESKQRYTSLRSGFENTRKEALALQAAFKKRLGQASSQLLQREMVRLEETSVQASIGIAKNLVLDTAGLQEGS